MRATLRNKIVNNFIIILSFAFCSFVLGCTPGIGKHHLLATKQANPPRFELNTKMRQMLIQLGNNKTALIYYEKPEWKRYAHQIEHVIQASVARIRHYLEITPGLYLEFILLNQATFNTFVTDRAWVKAAYHKGRVFIPIDEKRPIELPALAATITHELSHAVIANLSAGNAPGWLDEGLAMIIEGKDSYAAEQRYKDWLRFHKAPALTSLNTGFTHFDQEAAGHAYVRSKLAVQLLIERFGKEQLYNYLRKLAQEPDQEIAFQQVFEIPLQHF